MQGVVEQDQTVRTITVRVADVPDLDITRSWHSKVRSIRPDNLVIVVIDGRIAKATVTGGLVLKTGGASESARQSEEWFGDCVRLISDAPDWVRLICDTARRGTTEWNVKQGIVEWIG